MIVTARHRLLLPWHKQWPVDLRDKPRVHAFRWWLLQGGTARQSTKIPFMVSFLVVLLLPLTQADAAQNETRLLTSFKICTSTGLSIYLWWIRHSCAPYYARLRHLGSCSALNTWKIKKLKITTNKNHSTLNSAAFYVTFPVKWQRQISISSQRRN